MILGSFAKLRASPATGNVYSYFTSCGYRCAYQTMAAKAAAQRYSHYTTWAGWASGDFMSCCDHIFISQGVDVEAVACICLSCQGMMCCEGMMARFFSLF